MNHVVEPGAGKGARRLLRWILRDVVLLGLAFVALEVVLSILSPEYRGHVYDQEYTGGRPIAMNDRGFRGSRVKSARKPGEYRVLALGDSLTFGTGVASEDTWPERLREHLASRRPGPVAVLNTALPGSRIRDIAYAYETEWEAYAPDVAVVALSNNMVSQAWIGRDRPAGRPDNPYLDPERGTGTGIGNVATMLRRFVQAQAAPRFLKINVERVTYWIGLRNHRIDPQAPFGPLLAMGWRQPDLSQATAAAAWSVLEGDLGGLQATARKRGIPLYAAYVPARFLISDSPFDNEKRVPRDRLTIDAAGRAREICSRLAIPFLDATRPIRERRDRLARERGYVPSMYIQFDFSHLDADGHGALGQAIAGMLFPGSR